MALPAFDSNSPSPLSAALTPGPVDLAGWGLARVAYIRRVGDREWSIHAADGTRIGTATSRLAAFAALRQHGLDPLDAH